ncbi:MAG: efflux RND transporter periplasmic adaptor subunit [Calditrichia bacterium]
MKKRILIFSAVIVIIIIGIILISSRNSENKTHELVEVKKGTITVKALAVGELIPRNEISIKSKIGGIINKIYVEVGDEVNMGQIVAEVIPDPTPLELASLRREIELQEITLEKLDAEKKRMQDLVAKNLVSKEEYEQKLYAYKEAAVRLNMLKEKLSLIEKGKSIIADEIYESVLKSPIKGIVLEKFVNEGDPVVPLTSYQAGTALFTVADMNQLIFKGSLDEIDVGKVFEGMEAIIKIGALPDQMLRGTVTKIAPKGEKKDNATMFNIEIEIQRSDSIQLRAGYSANAEIIIQEKKDIPILPERVVHFRNDSAFVDLPGPENQLIETFIKTGISDGLTIEVTEGLSVGDKVVEPAQKEIS